VSWYVEAVSVACRDWPCRVSYPRPCACSCADQLIDHNSQRRWRRRPNKLSRRLFRGQQRVGDQLLVGVAAGDQQVRVEWVGIQGVSYRVFEQHRAEDEKQYLVGGPVLGGIGGAVAESFQLIAGALQQ
jgi:hypothetical protein